MQKEQTKQQQQELDLMVKTYEKEVEKLERKLVDFALEHDLCLCLGEYGQGRALLLEDCNYTDKKRGEWLYSSETC